MAGITATISIQAFAADWATHMPIADICARFTITKDQVLRLRDVWNLPLRNDRRLRFKPARGSSRDPTPSEIRRACLAIQATWDDRTREDRAVVKSQQFVLKRIELSADALEALEGFGDE